MFSGKFPLQRGGAERITIPRPVTLVIHSQNPVTFIYMYYTYMIMRSAPPRSDPVTLFFITGLYDARMGI